MSTLTSKSKTSMTADELFRMPDEDYGYELMKGELIKMSPPGGRHGELTAKLTILLGNYINLNQLGVLCAGDTGFILAQDPDTVRAPDVAFISKERLPPEGTPAEFWPLAPDLAVEVISPWDRYSEMQEKLLDYFQAGVKLVWVVDPPIRTIAAYSSPTEVRILTESDSIEAGDVIPGFSCSLSEIFS